MTTKAKREKQLRAALRQRVADIAIGAAGYDFDGADDLRTTEALARWNAALRIALEPMPEKRVHFGYFATIDGAVDLLFARGVRA